MEAKDIELAKLAKELETVNTELLKQGQVSERLKEYDSVKDELTRTKVELHSAEGP